MKYPQKHLEQHPQQECNDTQNTQHHYSRLNRTQYSLATTHSTDNSTLDSTQNSTISAAPTRKPWHQVPCSDK